MISKGETYESKNSGTYIIVNYINNRNITIKFLDTGSLMVVGSKRVYDGAMKDRMRPSIAGVGYVGIGDHSPTDSRNAVSREYNAWHHMIMRCYDVKLQIKIPTYTDCEVCDEWHNFQVFAEWFKDNYIDGYELDKDIKIKGNKLYSPSTCLFVSKLDNILEANKWKMSIVTVSNDDGRVEDVFNQSQFCKENGLQQANFNNMINGKRKSHKGWRLAVNNDDI